MGKYDVNKENMTLTTNGANTHVTTHNECLDFFALGGAMREKTEQDILNLFNAAYASDKLLAMKLLFYIRDIRGGQGERRTFRIILNDLAKFDPATMSKNLELIPEYGRWDDLYALVDTPLEKEMFSFIKKQFNLDRISNTPSLLAKWLKSENASSAETKKLATKTRKALKLSPKQYRKELSRLRQRIGVIERLISENKWDEIEYDKIPSNAGFKYSNAFARHDYERYSQFLSKAKNVNMRSVNAEALYPYEIVKRAYKYINYWSYDNITQTERDALEVYWKNLKDYFAGQSENYSAICVVDTSGSMEGTPLEVALSLGLYTAERCKGPFKDTFITFSKNPQLQQVVGEDVYAKLENMSSADWDMNTDIKKVFDLLLNKAVKGGLSQETLPQNIFIISDMQFDYCARYEERDANTLLENIAEDWKAAGYEMPHLIFWNVNASSRNIPVLGKGRISYVSGFSPSIFEVVLSNKTGYDLMLEVLNSERYSKITV